MIQAIIAQAFKLLLGQVFAQISDRTPVPKEFWERVAELQSNLAAAMLTSGGKLSDRDLEPYYQELHSLMRRFNLIETG